MKVSIIGAGSWGGALAKVLADNNHDVLMYEHTKERVDIINEKHIIDILQAEIPASIKATHDLSEAVNFSDTVVVAVPTKAMREVLGNMKEMYSGAKDYICVSKGIEPGTHLRMSQVFGEILGDKMNTYTVLTGPTHAEEVIKGMISCIVAGSSSEGQAIKVQELFNNSKYFRVYTSTDVIGCEAGGSLKNVIALASGFLHGCHQGDNASAALITRSLIEIEKIAVLMGAKSETIYGLTGLGDLIVTATSTHSRNFNAGLALARGEKIENLNSTIEGARTCKSAYEFVKKHGIYAPIFESVYKVLYEGEDVKVAISSILDREVKPEA